MSDTPISDSTPHNVAELGMLCRSLERELTASNAIIRQQQLLDEQNLRLQDRIKRLEEALNGTVKWIVDLADSGDAGFWNPEEQSVIIAARAALNKEAKP
jgi:uncharacterized protein with von Willebrand factor type A (vWA) domain